MGGKSSKSDGLSRSDMDWLIKHTKYNEDTIQEWYKGFRNSDSHLVYYEQQSCLLRIENELAFVFCLANFSKYRDI